MTSQEQSDTTETPGTTETDGISRFTFSEDWAAVVVGLAILVLALAGVITEGWLIL